MKWAFCGKCVVGRSSKPPPGLPPAFAHAKDPAPQMSVHEGGKQQFSFVMIQYCFGLRAPQLYFENRLGRVHRNVSGSLAATSWGPPMSKVGSG